MSENEKTKNGWGVLIAAVITVFVLWGLNWLLLWLYAGESDKRGQFGDMFGSVNALFSGLAFAFLIYTIWLQREELTLQREELKLQREALEFQAQELKRQADELEKTGTLQKESLELQKLNQEKFEREQDRKSKANFIQSGDFDVSLSNECRILLYLKNAGATAANVSIKGKPEIKDFDTPIEIRRGRNLIPSIKEGQVLYISWEFQNIEDIPVSLGVEINYIDSLGREQIQNLKVHNNKKAKNIEEQFKLVRL